MRASSLRLQRRIVDLSHPLAAGAPSYPGDPELRVRAHAEMPEAPCNVLELSMGSHQGTHFDAPFHFYENGRTVDQIPLDRFYGPAWLLDLAPRGALPPRTALTVDHFARFADRIKPYSRIVYRTGWDRRYGEPEFFTDFPTLTIEAARWFAERKISLLGMDTPTPSVDFREVHWALLAPGVEIVILEGLARLDQLPPRFVLAAFPLNITGGDGAPVRAVGIVG